jgi:diguanylate cyclase (GGDEF)-like protein
LRSLGITAIHVDKQNTVWIATFGGGLSRYNRDTDDFTTYLKNTDDINTLSSNNIMTINQTSDGNLWIGTFDSGISVFNPSTKSVLRIQTNPQNQTSLSANLVWTIHEDSANNIWVGTHGGGLNLLTSHNRERGDLVFQRLGKTQGLPSDVVFGILEDEFENLWVSSNRGLSKLDKESLSFTNFTYAQGLQGTEFNSGSYTQMPDGRMLFGGSDGVTAFYPSNVSLNQHLPETVISGFQRLDKVTNIAQQLDASGRLIVDYTDYLIGFEFIGLHFAAPEKNQYKYRLLGFNDEWLQVRDEPRAVYTNLLAGDYTFEVISANGDGLWNYDPSSVSITVKPAPWRSDIAYAIYGLLVLLAFYTTHRFQQRKQIADTKYRKALEDEVEKRTQELSQANQDLLTASITDQLTGLFNRRYFFNVIPDKSREIINKFSVSMARGQVNHDTGPRLFFLMFDLDGFKPINDTYGHDAGDQMIQQVAILLKEVCRGNDIVIRWGGDEFLIVGEVKKVDELAALAERIRDRIAKYSFNIGLSQQMYLSSSTGFALYPFNHHFPDALSWEQVHLMADNALYRSKDAGKNTWTGILECESPVPVSVMNALALNIDDAVNKNYVRLIKH